MDGRGLDLRDGTIPQSCGVVVDWMTARISRLCSIRITDPAYADWNSQCLQKLEINILSAGTGERYWNIGCLRPSGSDRASRIAGMAEIGVGDRPGPRHIWRRGWWWKKSGGINNLSEGASHRRSLGDH